MRYINHVLLTYIKDLVSIGRSGPQICIVVYIGLHLLFELRLFCGLMC